VDDERSPVDAIVSVEGSQVREHRDHAGAAVRATHCNGAVAIPVWLPLARPAGCFIASRLRRCGDHDRSRQPDDSPVREGWHIQNHSPERRPPLGIRSPGEGEPAFGRVKPDRELSSASLWSHAGCSHIKQQKNVA